MKIILIISLLLTLFGSARAQTSYDKSRLQQYYQNQEYEQAIAYLKTIQPPHDEAFLFDLGYSNYANSNYAEATKIFQQLYNRDPLLPTPQIYLALMARENRKTDSALFYYRNLTRLLPNNYRYWQSAAQLFDRKRQMDSALIYAQKAVELNPTSGSVVFDLADYLGTVKRNKEKEVLIDKFLSRDSGYKPIIGQKVEACFDTQQYEQAIKWGKRYKLLEGRYPKTYEQLLYSYLNNAMPDSVVNLYGWLNEQGLKTESAAYGAALAYTALKKYALSDSLLDECIKFNIQELATTYYSAKADNSIALKNYSRAASYYDTSYYIFHNPQDLFQAGRVYDANQNNRAKATSYYKRYLQAQPKPKTNNQESIHEYVTEYLKSQKK